MADPVEEVLDLLGAGLPFIYAAGAFGVFYYLDRQASADAKKVISGWLKPHERNRPAIAGTLVELFDRLYTRPLLGWRAATRAALFTSVITILVLYEVAPTAARFIEAFSREAGFPLAVILLSNIVSGYVSLFGLRHCLLVGTNRPAIAFACGALVSVLAVVAASLLRDLTFVILMHRTKLGAHIYPDMLSPVHLFDSDLLRFSVPALAVHLWLPLFGLGLLCLTGLNYSLQAVPGLRWLMEKGNEHPLDAIGYVLGILVLVGTGIARLVP